MRAIRPVRVSAYGETDFDIPVGSSVSGVRSVPSSMDHLVLFVISPDDGRLSDQMRIRTLIVDHHGHVPDEALYVGTVHHFTIDKHVFYQVI